ncbi:MAG: hypothetical protein OEV93_04350, partial [Candidatus Moranbacteria bacterium]|nr:hypothetical protein [Candidatus Moranbacteria bacterium]
MKKRIVGIVTMFAIAAASFGATNNAQADVIIHAQEMEVCSYDKHSTCMVEDTTTINVPVAGKYTVRGYIGRGTNTSDTCQAHEDFSIYVNGTFLATSKDKNSCEPGSKNVYTTEDLGSISLNAGANKVKMVHAYPVSKYGSTGEAESVSVALLFRMPNLNVSVNIDKNDNDNGDDTQNVIKGSNAAFKIKVTNTGQATLSNVKVVDAEAPACSKTFSNTLAPGASFTYTCSDANVTAAYTNVAVATATGFDGVSNVNVNHSDTSKVTVTSPSTVSIQIDKNDNDNGDDTQEVVSGGNAAFRIRVTNTGQATLSNV